MGTSLDGAVRKLFKGGGILFIGLVVQLGVSFFAKVIIARVLTPVNYGAVSLGVTTLGLLSTLSLLGIHSGIGRYLPRYETEEERRGILVSGFQIALPLATATGLTVAILAGPIARHAFTDPSVAPFLRVFGLAIPFAALMNLSIGVIQGNQEALPKVVVQNVTPPVTRFTAVGIAVVIGAGAIGIATAYALAYVIAALVGLWYVLRRTSLLSDVTPVMRRRELLSFSAPLVVTAAMGFILSDLDTFMLGYFSSTAAVGVYNVVYPIAQLLTVGISAFGFLFMPIISELDAEGAQDEMHRVYQVITKWVFMGTLPVFLVVALFPEMTIAVTFGEKYMAGGTALSLLAIAYFSHAIAGPNANTLTSIGRTRTIMWDNIAIAVLNFLLNLLLIPQYGYLGAGAATAVSYIILNLLYSTQLYRETGIHPFSAALVKPGVVAVILVAVVYWVTRTFFPITIPVLIGMFSIFMLLYGLVIIRFGGIEEEEIMLVLSFEDRFDINLGPLKDIAKFLMR
ncbi:flippase [Salarchaeum sp. III]|uniref:flippase n=1 Tax=Salarchaeum sp. III TaxID=3107927 RepID=UPI002ED81BA7